MKSELPLSSGLTVQVRDLAISRLEISDDGPSLLLHGRGWKINVCALTNWAIPEVQLQTELNLIPADLKLLKDCVTREVS
jgi:hypothetical protein